MTFLGVHIELANERQAETNQSSRIMLQAGKGVHLGRWIRMKATEQAAQVWTKLRSPYHQSSHAQLYLEGSRSVKADLAVDLNPSGKTHRTGLVRGDVDSKPDASVLMLLRTD